MTMDEIAIHEAMMSEVSAMKITDMMADKPCAFICSCYFLLFIVSVIAGSAGWFDVAP